MAVGIDGEETENRVHKIVKNNGQNIEHSSISGCEVWGAKEKNKIIFWNKNLSDGGNTWKQKKELIN